ncbi:unnamed protein product [Lathyrus sativus]|nr:unnamed protein product [Lathyrus sativus]
MSDPSGSYGGWKVGAIDANNQAAQSILKQDYKDDITKEEAVQLALTEWPEGPLEEIVQNGIKSWEMELSHKIRLQDFKTIVPKKLKLFFNGSLCYFGHLAPIAD